MRVQAPAGPQPAENHANALELTEARQVDATPIPALGSDPDLKVAEVGAESADIPDSGGNRGNIDLSAPSFMKASARRGLQLISAGYAGDGVDENVIREAKAMAQGIVTAEKWLRLRGWVGRHTPDLDSPSSNPDSPDFPGPSVVSHLLWGSGPGKRAAQRTMAHAGKVVGRLGVDQTDRGATLRAIETRTTPLDDMEIRKTAEGMFFEGYAALWNSPSRPLPFTERIAPGAFIRSLKSRNDHKLLWNHDTSAILGSTRAGTLKLVEDERGLKVSADLPNTTVGRDASELLMRGDVDSMSFGFSVPKGGDEWNVDGTERTLREVSLHEVSIVAFPAYDGTTGLASVRGLDKVAKRANVDLESLSDAILKLENGETMTSEDTRILNEVLDSIAPEHPKTADVPVDEGFAMLELKKHKLKLLELLNG